MDQKHDGASVREGVAGSGSANPGCTDGSVRTPVLDEQEAENAARLAFDAYFAARADAYGSNVGRLYEDNRDWHLFVEIGKTCLSNGWSPSEYVSKTFKEMAVNGGLVLPSNLATKTAMQAFEKRKKSETLPPEDLWTESERVVTELVVKGATEKQVLSNPMLSFPAWFRIFYPEELDSDLVATFGTRAKSELTNELEDFIRSKNAPALDMFLGLWQDSRTQTTQTPCLT